MENLRKRVDVKLVNSRKKANKLTSKPSFHAFRIFTEDLVAVQMLKQKLYLNRPIYVGFSILDISKTLMYDFHYNYVKQKYGARARLLFTDTDSLAYVVQTEDVYRDMLGDSQLFDTSEYPINHPLYNLENKKVLGKIKDETCGNAIQAFIGLKSKMYAYVYDVEEETEVNGEITTTIKNIEKKKAKGVVKHVVQNHIRYEQYKKCLFDKKIHMAEMHQIRSYGHQLYNISTNKLSLSPYDDKRFLLKEGITGVAYGHWRITRDSI